MTTGEFAEAICALVCATEDDGLAHSVIIAALAA